MSEYGFYRVPNLGFNKITGQGSAFLYFTKGVACSEVLINKNTGEVKVLRSDILMDIGKSIDEELDRGQIIGAFVQGMGWLTTENLVYDKKGRLVTHAPSTYKIHSIHDIPRVLNVDFYQPSNNKKNVLGSKAVGEPPLLLAFSAWTAIIDAYKYLTPSQNLSRANLNIPSTNEEIFMNCHRIEAEQF